MVQKVEVQKLVPHNLERWPITIGKLSGIFHLISKINNYYIRKGKEKQNYITEKFRKNKKCDGLNLKRIKESKNYDEMSAS